MTDQEKQNYLKNATTEKVIYELLKWARNVGKIEEREGLFTNSEQMQEARANVELCKAELESRL